MPKLILIIDNDEKTRMILERLFFEEGYRTIVVDDGWEGIKSAIINEPDLIVMDILIPNFDGLIVCDVIKRYRVTSKIPLIIFTDVEGEVRREIAKKLGADSYVNKRFGRDKLLEATSQLLPTS